MINMRRFFKLFVFTLAMILIETPQVRADGSYYDLLKKTKNPSTSEKSSLRHRAHEERRRRMNELSQGNLQDAQSTTSGHSSGIADDQDADDSASDSTPQRRRSEPVYHSDTPSVKVNPGDTEALVFPGDSAESPPPKKNK